jgi:hypothetical protein
MKTCIAGFLNDFQVFDPRLAQWVVVNATDKAGAFPSARAQFGMTSLDDKIYVYGGNNLTGEQCFPRGQTDVGVRDGLLVGGWVGWGVGG